MKIRFSTSVSQTRWLKEETRIIGWQERKNFEGYMYMRCMYRACMCR